MTRPVHILGCCFNQRYSADLNVKHLVDLEGRENGTAPNIVIESEHFTPLEWKAPRYLFCFRSHCYIIIFFEAVPFQMSRYGLQAERTRGSVPLKFREIHGSIYSIVQLSPRVSIQLLLGRRVKLEYLDVISLILHTMASRCLKMQSASSKIPLSMITELQALVAWEVCQWTLVLSMVTLSTD